MVHQPLGQRRDPQDLREASRALDGGNRFLGRLVGHRRPYRRIRRITADQKPAARIMPAVEMPLDPHEANHTPALAHAGDVATCDASVIEVALLMVSCADVTGLLATAG